jgi:hypothetical protein
LASVDALLALALVNQPSFADFAEYSDNSD